MLTYKMVQELGSDGGFWLPLACVEDAQGR
jgi:hypothetical protein